ncbi:MAG: polysaccharide biosynthesis C-terminal domain-containing protein [Acetobacter sp.]|nr:polysaccharide biosynthesis C-terminal domain-containing protein [Bacteroides sp.]MCM1340681.1 polysaccharide biosynthesis C-terminal domain-containing protein [Acetobacter sp.]MCM1433792.1 polysaccharide biosynthesis C-terminal domain-containing protein [Clostridiales bacterium]
MEKGIKQKYISSAVFMLAATILVKVISAVYKIPLTTYIGATGRGYFSIAYNLCLPVHALTMGAFPIALTKLVSSCNAKGNAEKIAKLWKASKKLFFIVGISGMVVILLCAKPYADFISSSPKSIYTIMALAPSVFFSCLAACHRAFSEGFLDMKPTAISQLIEAFIKLIFGLLLAKSAMSYLYDFYYINGTVLGVVMDNEKQALSAIYPLTSAAAMLGTTLGSMAAYVFSKIYTCINYSKYKIKGLSYKNEYDELLRFCAPLVLATVIQSISNFLDTSSIQYCLSLCNKETLAEIYKMQSDDIYTYVFGIFAAALDFKNLVPAIVMALGVTAVPAVSSAFESSAERFSKLINEIFKYTVILGVGGGLVLSLFSNELLDLFYSKNNADIVMNAERFLFYSGVTILPCCFAVTSVYCTQALGFAKQTIVPFAIGAGVKVALNFLLVSNSEINILGTCVSNFFGFLVIIIANMITIHKKTNTKFDLKSLIIKPVFVGILTYFAVDYVKTSLFLDIGKFYLLVILLIILAVFYSILLMIFKIISIGEIKLLK